MRPEELLIPRDLGGPMGAPFRRIDMDFGPMFEEYKVTYGANLEFIADTLYDTQAYVSGTTIELPFFVARQASIADGNVQGTGTQLADKVGFLIMGIRWKLLQRPRSIARAAAGSAQTGALDNLAQLENGVLRLKFLDKDYGHFPLFMLPAGGGAVGGIAAEGATADPGGVVDYANNGMPDARNTFVLEQPLFWPPVTTIDARMFWDAAVTLAGANTDIKLAFDGLKVRPIQ